MSDIRFEEALSFVLRWEGYKSENFVEYDPGGRTIFGISHRYYPNEVEAMWQMSREDALKVASKIYRRDYWDAVGGDVLPPETALVAFDSAVNCGPGEVNRWMRESSNPVDLLFMRMTYYAKLKHFDRFGRGWINRVCSLYKEISR